MNTQPAIGKFDEKSVREFVARVYAAWESLNADNLAPYFRKAPQDTHFHLYSMDYCDWNAYKKHVQQFLDEHASLSIKVSDERVFQEGDVVYVAVCYDMQETYKDGKNTSREGRYTGVLLPSGKSWRIVHEHWSVPVRAAGWENY